MANRNKKPNGVSDYAQLPLGLDLEIERTVRRLKETESKARSEVSIYTDTPLPPNLPPLLLPRRYEVLEAEAEVRRVQLRPLIRPVQEALQDISREIHMVKETRMGRLYVITGLTGSGKTTFLRSLKLFLSDIQVYALVGIGLDNRAGIENALAL